MCARCCSIRIACLVLLASGPAACGGDKPAAPEVPIVRPVVREVTDHEDFIGRTDAAMRVKLQARVSGYLLEARFKDGDQVKQGDVLFEIDPRPYQAQLAQTIAQINLHKTTLNLARLKLAREQAIAKATPGSISQQQLEQDRAAVEEAEARLKAAEAGADIHRLNLDFCKVTAPISGRIGRREIDPGNLVNADRTALATIVSAQPMYVYFDMDERNYLRLRASLPNAKPADKVPVAIGLANEKGFPHRGELSFINNQFDVNTGAIHMRAVLANKERRLLPGMFVRVRVTMSAPYKALLIPDRAVASDLDRKYVCVVDAQSKVEYRKVRAGPLQPDGLRVIRKGLEPDDRVITGALARWRPGMVVRPQKAETPAPKAPPPQDQVPRTQGPAGAGIRVEASYAGANAQRVYDTVGYPIERQLNGLENLEYLRSRCTSDGGYALDIAFAGRVDPWLSVVRVQNRVALALPHVPAEVREAGISVLRGSAGVLAVVTLSAPEGKLDRGFLGNVARVHVQDHLSRLAGVSAVTRVGGPSDYGMRVWLNTDRLAAYGLNAADVIGVLREKKWDRPAKHGDIDDLIIRANSEGESLRVRDVAKVEFAASGPSSEAFQDGRPVVALFVRLSGEVAPAKVRTALRERFTDLRDLLPEGVALDVAFDFTANLAGHGKTADADYVLIDLDFAATSDEHIADVLEASAAKLREAPAVKHVLALSYNPFDAFGGRPCLLARLSPVEHGKADRDETIRTIRTRLATLKDVHVRLRDLSAPGSFPRCGYPIDLALVGPKASEVREWADKLGERLRQSIKLADVWVNRDSVPRLTRYVDIDRDRAAALGVNVTDVLGTLEIYTGAVPVNRVSFFGRSMRMEVQASPRPGDSVTGLGNLMVRNAKGQMVPLKDIVRVRQVQQPMALDFLDLRPMVEITANAAAGVSREAAQKLCTTLAEEVRREMGLSAEYRLLWLHAIPRAN